MRQGGAALVLFITACGSQAPTPIKLKKNGPIVASTGRAIVRQAGNGKLIRLSRVRSLQVSCLHEGRHIAFAVPHRGLYVMNRDGRAIHRLNVSPSVLTYDTFSWDPSGQAFAFDDAKTGGISVVRLGGQDKTVLTRAIPGKTFDHSPTWSPDGRSIAFVHVAADEDLFAVSPHGGKPHPLYRPTDAPPDFDALQWSPDGRRIAFVQGIFLHRAVGQVRADGTEARTLVRLGALRFLPHHLEPLSWSPDGRWIAFLREDGIWKVPQRGGKARILLRGRYYSFSWCPASP